MYVSCMYYVSKWMLQTCVSKMHNRDKEDSFLLKTIFFETNNQGNLFGCFLGGLSWRGTTNYDNTEIRKNLQCKGAFQFVCILLRPSGGWLTSAREESECVLFSEQCGEMIHSRKLLPEVAITEHTAHWPAEYSFDIVIRLELGTSL